MLNLEMIVDNGRQHRSAGLVLPWLLDRARDFGAPCPTTTTGAGTR